MEKNSVYDKWKSFGFLRGLDDEEAHALAEKYEELGQFMSQNVDNLKDSVLTIAFPVLRRAFTRGLNEKYSPRAVCEKIKNEYEEGVRELKMKNPGNPKFDAEAEFADEVAKYFSINKNEKPR